MISMNEYAKSLEKLEVRNGKLDEELTREELKVYKKCIGKLNWLTSNTRLDMLVYVMNFARKQKKATLKGT